jgi:hypothetical protein
MKKLFILAAVVFAILSFQSCGTYYEYIQLLSTKPVNENAPITQTNGGIIYEDDDCAIFYKFWNEGGNPGFEFYNKTDKIIYIDLSKTFFIKNGTAYDYFQQETITNTKSSSASTSEYFKLSATHSYSSSISQYYSGNFGYVPPALNHTITSTKLFGGISIASITKSKTTNNTSSVATTNNPILSIPPKSSKIISNFSITSQEIIDCNLKYYPEKYSKIEYTTENSPIIFANYITFKIGEDAPYKNVKNDFFVNEISNYATHEITNYNKREKTCKNILTPEEIKKQKKQIDVYDPYIIVGDESSFYTTYSVYSKSKLYTKNNNYLWSYKYNGYINKNSKTKNNLSNSVQKIDNSSISETKNSSNLTKIINDFDDPKEVSSKQKNRLTSEILEIKDLYSKKNLLKSNVFIAYKEYANQIINSTKKGDWNKLESIQELLKEIIKTKNSNLFLEIENSVSATNNLEEKINILVKYLYRI